MLRVWGTIVKNGKIIASDTYTSARDETNAALLDCLEHFARAFDVEIPMWHTAHTQQLAKHKKAVFSPDDFIDKVNFDKFEIQILGL